MPIRIVVYSSIRLFAESLASCLKKNLDFVEVKFHQRPESLVESVQTFDPDIVLVDVTSERALHDARAAYVCNRRAVFVALAVPEIPQEVIACADAGFVAYVPRAASIEELTGVIGQALKGECACHPKIVGSLLREVGRRHGSTGAEIPDPPPSLTHRESEILGLLAQGLPNKAIALKLNLSISTVKSHLHKAFAKLQVKCRTEAIAKIKNQPHLLSAVTLVTPSGYLSAGG